MLQKVIGILIIAVLYVLTAMTGAPATYNGSQSNRI
jgi:hypothetical protein